MRFLAVLSLVCLFAAGCGGSSKPSGTQPAGPKSRPANGPVVLGAKDFVSWGGLGFGMPHPSRLNVGSDPSVLITNIRWHNWGRQKAWGVGRYAPPHIGHGGDYGKRLQATLRTHGIGRCRPNGPRTYMALKVKVALQPGQRPGWYEVDGSHGLCSYP